MENKDLFLEVAEGIADLSIKAREYGLKDLADDLLTTALAHASGQGYKYSRQQMAGAIRGLAAAAKANDLKYTAYNLSFVCLATAVGEEAEVILGSEMLPYAKKLGNDLERGDLFWPDELD